MLSVEKSENLNFESVPNIKFSGGTIQCWQQNNIVTKKNTILWKRPVHFMKNRNHASPSAETRGSMNFVSVIRTAEAVFLTEKKEQTMPEATGRDFDTFSWWTDNQGWTSGRKKEATFSSLIRRRGVRRSQCGWVDTRLPQRNNEEKRLE